MWRQPESSLKPSNKKLLTETHTQNNMFMHMSVSSLKVWNINNKWPPLSVSNNIDNTNPCKLSGIDWWQSVHRSRARGYFHNELGVKSQESKMFTGDTSERNSDTRFECGGLSWLDFNRTLIYLGVRSQQELNVTGLSALSRTTSWGKSLTDRSMVISVILFSISSFLSLSSCVNTTVYVIYRVTQQANNSCNVFFRNIKFKAKNNSSVKLTKCLYRLI